MADNNNSDWLRKPHISRRAALRAAILGATLPGALYLAKATNSADAADGDIYIPGAPNFLELGHGWPGKEANAGKIAYRQWSDALDIVGAGTQPGYRKVKIWDDLYIQGLLNLRAYIVDPEVPRTWTAFLYAKDVNGQSKPFWKDATGTAQPLVARSATLVVAASDASPRSKLGADFVCGGTADEVEINAAIAALPSSGGKVVLTEGTFTLGAAITWQSKNDVTLEGQGFSTIIKMADATNAKPIDFSSDEDKYRWVFRDFKLDGNTANQTGPIDTYHGIHVRKLHDSRFENLWIADAHSDGLRIQQGARNVVSSCRIDGAADACIYITAGGADENVVQNCWLGNNIDDSCIRIRYSANRNKIIGCTVYNPLGEVAPACAIEIQGTAGLTCTGNEIIGCTVDCNDTVAGARDSDGISVGAAGYVYHTVVKGNYVVNADQGIYALGGNNIIQGNFTKDCDTGIQADAADNVIADNRVENCNDNGIYLNGSDRNSVIGNICWNNGAAGIRITNSTHCVIVGNECFDDQGTPTQARGIDETGSSDNNLIAGNNVYDNRWDNIVKVGASTIVRDNKGYVTENGGTDTIPAGQTSVTVAHGLDVTPTSIHVTPQANPGPDGVWVSAVDGTNITVSRAGSTGALSFHWEAKKL